MNLESSYNTLAEQWIEEGIEIVKNLIAAGVEIELIIKTSKLSKEEIEEIKRQMNN